MTSKDFLAKTFDLTAKAVLITGASSGFGEHFARMYAKAGVKTLALLARRTDRLETLAQELTAEFPGLQVAPIKCDVSRVQDIPRAFDEAEKVTGKVFDVIVNNAGIGPVVPVLKETEASYDSTMNVNMKGAFFVAVEAANRMVAQGCNDGSIINISSIFGLRVGYGHAVYSVSKAALIQMTKAMALELIQKGIRVNSVNPGYFRTELTQEYYDSPKGALYIDKHLPIKRLGLLEELDGVMLLLSSNASKYMYGSILTVDGGHAISSL